MKGLIASIFGILMVPTAYAATNIGMDNLLSFVIYLVIIGLVFWCIWWFLGYVGVPEPFNKVIRVVIGLVALIIVVNLLLGLVGTPIFNLR